MWRITEGFHGAMLLRTLLGVVRVGAMLVFVWLSKTTIDCATGRTEGSLPLWFSLMVCCMLSEIALSQWGRYIETRSSVQMNNRINRRLFNTLMAMPLVQGKQGFHSGDMLNRLTLDVRTVSTFALSQLPTLVAMVVQLLAAFAFLAWLNPWLALAPVVVMPLCLLASKLYFKRQRRLTAEVRQGESDMHVSIQEGLKHRMVFKSLECVGEVDHRLGTIQDRLEASNREQARLSATSNSLVRAGFVIGYLTAFGWSVFGLRAGVITFGTMTAFIQLVNRIQHPIANLAGYVPAFVAASVAIDRLQEIDIPVPAAEGKCVLLPSAGVHVDNVSFKYESEAEDILSSFSYDFKPGSRTMVVGPTGAGKTTLIKLLLGLLSPDAGTIEVYGDGLSQPASVSTLCNFVYVPQGYSLMPGTIRENLLLAAPAATDEQLAEALRIAAADFAYDLPNGLDTACDEAGGGLSEGQAQRIAIARALLRPGSVMLLDEFNSALDAETAATLMQRLSAARPYSTIIIIAHHRTAIAPYCDAVLPING